MRYSIMTGDTTERIEELEAENAELRERLEDIESALDGAAEEIEDQTDGSVNISRRGALAALAAAGVIGVGATGSAAAQDAGDPITIGDYIGFDDDSFLSFLHNTHDGTGDARAVLGVSDAENARAFVGQATHETGDTRGLVGRVSSENGAGLVGITDADSGSPVGIRAINNGDAPDAIGIESDAKAVIHDDLEIDSGGEIHIEDGGHLNVSGTKHFVHAVETPAGNKKVRYTSVEAGKALTEVSEVAEMDGGRAEIELPEHFGMVTSDEEPLSVQVTPYASEEVQPQVVEQSTDCIVVEDFSDTDYDYTFAYTVKGVREGFEDEEIVVDDE